MLSNTFQKLVLLVKKTAGSVNKQNIKKSTLLAWDTATFGFLIIIFIANVIIARLETSRFWPSKFKFTSNEKFRHFYDRLVSFLDHSRDRGGIRRVELIELVIRNMQIKKTRSFVTIGGMAIGIAAIVFLVSIGYGLQNVVITRVARLDEMKQIDVSSQSGSQLKINDSIIKKLQKVKKVDEVLPLIGVVAKVNYNLSLSDMPAYGVTSNYLLNSAIKPVKGKIFSSNHLAYYDNNSQKVKGATTKLQTHERNERGKIVKYVIYPQKWVVVYSRPDDSSSVLGYSRYVAGDHYGAIYYGQYYDEGSISANDKNGDLLSGWIGGDFSLWKDEPCTKSDYRCEEGKYIINQDEQGAQMIKEGFIKMTDVNIYDVDSNKIKTADINSPQVLGTSSALVKSQTASPSSLFEIDLDKLIASESGTTEQSEVTQMKLGKNAYREAIVNRAMLRILNLSENEAVGKTFDASFVVVSDLLGVNKKIQSDPAKYTIIGVIPDEKSPFFYVPLYDLRSLGIINFSQVKLVMTEKDAVEPARKTIEGMGFETASVADTVFQINNLFSSARLVLALLGTVALAVAALGMFNTLTVSLLERTHEVGLMKAMGMKSFEVQELFLTESMVMGFTGGIAGLIIGIIAGKSLGLILSFFTIMKGIGYLDISTVPMSFVFIIILLSLIVGFTTGFYPARRAKKISALNALRYE